MKVFRLIGIVFLLAAAEAAAQVPPSEAERAAYIGLHEAHGLRREPTFCVRAEGSKAKRKIEHG